MLVIASGLMTMRALEVADALRDDRIDVADLHVPTIKPLDEATILREAGRGGPARGGGREPHGDRAPTSARRWRRPADAHGTMPECGFRQIGLPDEFLDAGALPTLHDRTGSRRPPWRGASADGCESPRLRRLGAMGLPMAGHLVAAGFSVRGYDVRAESRAAVVPCGAGARPAGGGAQRLTVPTLSS